MREYSVPCSSVAGAIKRGHSDRLRALREGKNLSQGEVEKRTGLRRCYISRVEHGYTVPAIETLEKLARAMEVPMYQLFYDGEESLASHISRSARTARTLRGVARARMRCC